MVTALSEQSSNSQERRDGRNMRQTEQKLVSGHEEDLGRRKVPGSDILDLKGITEQGLNSGAGDRTGDTDNY